MKPSKSDYRQSRKRRIRAKVKGSTQRPRLSVFCSLTAISAQVIDDTSGKTLAASRSKSGEKNMNAAKKVGEEIAQKAKAMKVTAVVFDRNARKYHGRIKALADAARAGGLQF